MIDNDATVFAAAWSSFNERIPTDQAAVDYLYESLVIHNKIQCSCPHPLPVHEAGARFYTCTLCKHVSWITSGTLFAGVVKVRSWLALIWFKEHGITISSLKFSRMLDIAQSTALNIQRRLGMVIEKNMNGIWPELTGQVFSQIIQRRSAETPAQEHPKSECDDSPPAFYAFERAEEWLKERLSECPASDSDVINFSFVKGAMQDAAVAAINYIRTHFQGVSRKCLQLYLAAFWCHIDRKRWAPGSMLLACLEHSPISYQSIRAYLSPMSMKLFTCTF